MFHALMFKNIVNHTPKAFFFLGGNYLNEKYCEITSTTLMEETQEHNQGISGSSETELTDSLHTITPFGVTLCFATLQTFFMLKQQHFTLKKVNVNVKKKKSII